MSAVKIKQDVIELKKIDAEIKRINDILKPLRARKKELETNLLQYMESTNGGVTTIKLNDVEVVSVEKTKHEKLSKVDKEKTGIQLLSQYGVNINNAKKAYYDLQEMLKGKESVVPSLKLRPPKPSN